MVLSFIVYHPPASSSEPAPESQTLVVARGPWPRPWIMIVIIALCGTAMISSLTWLRLQPDQRALAVSAASLPSFSIFNARCPPALSLFVALNMPKNTSSRPFGHRARTSGASTEKKKKGLKGVSAVASKLPKSLQSLSPSEKSSSSKKNPQALLNQQKLKSPLMPIRASPDPAKKLPF
eukprot:1509457-Rhodomonas_salina.2